MSNQSSSSSSSNHSGMTATDLPALQCAYDRHYWPDDAVAGDTCNCGEWYRFDDHIEEAPLSDAPAPLTQARETWQPIETAPKDGRYILLAERVDPTQSDLHRNPGAQPEMQTTVGAYGRSNGNYFEWHRYGVGLIHGHKLTHWMPLPDPPADLQRLSRGEDGRDHD